MCLTFAACKVSAFDFLTAAGAHPIGGLFGIPPARFSAKTATTPAAIEAAGQSSQIRLFPRNAVTLVSLDIQADYSNIFAGGMRDGQRLLLDGETTRGGTAIVMGVGQCWQLAADIQQVSHRPGSLDNSIEQWHSFFGMPDARRDETERNRLKFVLETAESRLELQSRTRSPGDTVLQIAYHSDCGIAGKPLPADLWFAGVKLPTGELDEFSGSGRTDVFFGLQSDSIALGSRVSAGARLGLLFPGQPTALPPLSSSVAFASAGLQWRPKSLEKHGLQLLAQLDMHSPLFKSGLRELGNYTAQLAIGARWKPHWPHQFTAAFLEDVAVDTAPDLLFHFHYRYYW